MRSVTTAPDSAPDGCHGGTGTPGRGQGKASVPIMVSMTAHTEHDRRSLERRYTLMAAAWLVFLVFPAAGVATSDASATARAAGMVGLAVFAALDILVIVRMGPPERWGTGDRVALAGICACCLVAIGLVPLLGSGVAGLLPYVVSLTSYALPLRWAWASLVAAIAVAVGGPAVSGDLARWWPLTVVVLAVGVLSLGGRLAEIRAAEVRQAQEEARLADERDRMARDVHDVLGHTLTVIAVKTELAQRLVDRDPERARAEVAQIGDLARQSLAEIRSTVSGIRVARLTEELENARTVLEGCGITADLPGSAEEVDPRHRITVAWALREAVTNVVRHSRARTCTVRLGPGTLLVEDDGVGTRGARARTGLSGLGERVTAAGGTLDVGPRPDRPGTRVEVTLPIGAQS